jgi:hypothetical protein
MPGKRKTVFAASLAVVFGGSVLAEDWIEPFDDYPEGPVDGHGGWQGSAQVSAELARSEPNSLRLGVGDTALRLFSGYDHGLWRMAAWQYIPANTDEGSTYFMLHSRYDDGDGDIAWSTQLRFDTAANVVVSEYENTMRPLVYDAWVEIVVLIDLYGDSQWISYNGSLLSTKSWTEGVSGNGELNIAAISLYSASGPGDAYYDDLSLIEEPPVGACCYRDGGCQDDTDPIDCEAAGGWFQGVNTFCDMVDCPVYGDCGWELTAPTVLRQTIEGNPSHCDYLPGEDEFFTVNIPFDGDWTFSLCGGADWDTVLALGSECCGTDLGTDDDGCGEGSLQSKLHFEHLSAGEYYLLLESKEPGAGGQYTLTIDTPTVIECPPSGVPEAEPCGEDTNGGCGMQEPGFEPIMSERVVCATAWFDGSNRDTDWYEIVLSPDNVPKYVGLHVTAEFNCVFGLVEYREGHEGSGDCNDITGFLEPWLVIAEGEARLLELCIEEPGTYWLFVAPDFDNPIIECGEEEIRENDYTLRVYGIGVRGDISGPEGVPDGVVNVLDLLALLADWGCEGPPQWCLGDISGPYGEPDGVTNTNDLLALLAHWGETWLGAAR